MIKLAKMANITVVLLAFTHMLLGVLTTADSEFARLWFLGSGLGILFFAFYNLSAFATYTREKMISPHWVVANILQLLLSQKVFVPSLIKFILKQIRKK